jgi:hypothetical protein
MRIKGIKPTLLLTLIFLLLSLFTNAQLNGADSAWFSQIFNSPMYVTNKMPNDHFFVHNDIQSTADLHNILATDFKFSLPDFKSIDAMLLNDTIFYDTDRNTTYNQYPLAFNQQDPLTYIKFELNAKKGTAFNFLYPRTSPNNVRCDRAFLIIPGNGNNTASEIVQGYGQYNELCYLSNDLRNAGDVYAMMKPNEDARAIYWNKYKLDHPAVIDLLINNQQRYGLNYLIEIIATIKTLKQKYNQVILLGAAEGGYASLLASMVTHPFATIISGGYSIAFDTSMPSYNVLLQKFDSLVSIYDHNVIKNNILTYQTKYLFAWGNNEPIVLMQAEHDSKYTESFFNDTTKISYHYNFTGHTFPYCSAIDSFLNKQLNPHTLSFIDLNIDKKDTLTAFIQNCNLAYCRFDLYKNNIIYKSYDYFKGDTIIQLIDTGTYYLKNISTLYGDHLDCNDTIFFIKTKPYSLDYNFGIHYNNPVSKQLVIKNNLGNKSRRYEMYDLFGNCKFRMESLEPQVEFNMSNYLKGVYILKVIEGPLSEVVKIIKI